jgi:hypothetical protein
MPQAGAEAFCAVTPETEKALAKANASCVLEKSNRLSGLEFFAELTKGTRSKREEQQRAGDHRRRFGNSAN